MSGDQALLRKAERYLQSARLLVVADDLDSAVSRAYYAAFFIAEALLDRQGQEFSSHKAVISAFGREFAKTGVLDPAFHRMLIGAFEKRQHADYLASPGFVTADVDELIQDVERFRQTAEDWLVKPREAN